MIGDNGYHDDDDDYGGEDFDDDDDVCIDMLDEHFVRHMIKSYASISFYPLFGYISVTTTCFFIPFLLVTFVCCFD